MEHIRGLEKDDLLSFLADFSYCNAGRGLSKHFRVTATEWAGNTCQGLEDVRSQNGSGQGQNMALTGLYVPSSLDCCR